MSEISVPILSQGKVIGVIDSEHKDKNHYTNEHLKTLESIASLVAIKIRTALSIRERKKAEAHNIQLLSELEKSNDELHEYAHIVSHDLKSPFTATRYHSLAIEPDSMPAILQITATSEDGTIMGISHLDKNITGVQFHPEAALTEFGYELLANWLELCGDLGARNRAVGLSVLVNTSN